MHTWSATDDEPHCGLMPAALTILAGDGLLQVHAADDTVVSWLRNVAMKTHAE